MSSATSTENENVTLDELCARPTPYDHYWSRKQPYLEGRGYMLRPRYRPGWTPSWRRTGCHVLEAEDAETIHAPDGCIDAIRLSDGKMVFLKRVPTHGSELAIATYFSKPEQRQAKANHCVPVLDVILDDENPELSYLVMPFLRYVDNPAFETIGDAVHFVDQILEGLAFLHKHGIAHRDCTGTNIMMDASSLFPSGFHPITQSRLHDYTGHAPKLRRSEAAPVEYYFTDFGLSSRSPGGAKRKRVIGNIGLDRSAPELSDTDPYDPFKLDIYLVGNNIRTLLLAKYSNVDFLEPLVSSMTTQNPLTRPDAYSALRYWQNLRNYRSLCLEIRRAWRLWGREENFAETMILDALFLVRMAYAFFLRVSEVVVFTLSRLFSLL